MHHFHLQAVEKALGAGIVVTFALGAHAAYQAVLTQERLGLVVRRTILAAPVGMHDHSLGLCLAYLKVTKKENSS